MAHFTAQAEQIPGLVTAGWVFKGTTMDERQVSLVWLEDAGSTALIDVTGGLAKAAQAGELTARMRSYLTGLAEIGGYFRRRKTIDEDEVTEDDIEMGAIVFAFPRVAMNEAARRTLKSHLDMLQAQGLIDRIAFTPNRAQAAEAAPEPATAEPARDAETPEAAKPEAAKPEAAKPEPVAKETPAPVAAAEKPKADPAGQGTAAVSAPEEKKGAKEEALVLTDRAPEEPGKDPARKRRGFFERA